MRQYYVLTSNSDFLDVFTFIRNHNLEFSAHLNRTRFWVPDGPTLTEFLLRFAHTTSLVSDSDQI
jgi:hypothetical protein